MEPFLIRALAAGLGLAVVSAPLGCFVVWNRMAYFGETIAQASLIGIALGLFLKLDLTLAVLAVAVATAALLVLLSRQKVLPLDSILGIVAHAALAAGVIATTLVKGINVDLMGYLFGDILAVSTDDLWWVYCGGTVVLAALWWIWQPLLALAVHEELERAAAFRLAVRFEFRLQRHLALRQGFRSGDRHVRDFEERVAENWFAVLDVKRPTRRERSGTSDNAFRASLRDR